ncbi:4-hydroxy-3-methylbut-2-enyl diphosphate reductase [Cryomorphaceae bacterium 1068]|nr:4-hydroxy-3-methylbut-2-enyl diphosphate reductase [Cryomorphaceae bacterium 1068]
MKSFEVPEFYRSPIIAKVKESRKITDPRKKDFSPSVLDFGPVQFLVPRHFGFCYGVENAIEISYRAIEENPDKRIFLLSQMIHNPTVNADLESKGIKFIMDTQGNQFVDWDELRADDIVIIPAFGTTVEIMELLAAKDIQVEKYNTTCPFVEKVWKRSDQLGKNDFSVIIHGKIKHEETRATFSHSYQGAPSVVILNMDEAVTLGQFIRKERPMSEFYEVFAGKYSEGFDPSKDLERVGVVNQTTMLATETQGIADYFKQTMIDLYGEAEYKNHFADTRDTLCYATNDNQRATLGVLKEGADLALVVGGYNSSNTSHIVELCEEKMPTYFISSKDEIKSKEEIHHFNYPDKKMEVSKDWLMPKSPLRIVLTSGASCPDATVDAVMQTIISFFDGTRNLEEVLEEALVTP